MKAKKFSSNADTSVVDAQECKRLLLVSDTHGAVDRAVAELVDQVDAVVHAGDIGNGSVLRTLRPASGRLYAVRGNNDTPVKWPAGDRAALAGLLQSLSIALPGGLLIVTHADSVRPASARHAGLRERYPEARVVVYGHTHRAVCDRAARPWVLNPGAAGRTRTFGGPSCMLLDVRRGWRVRLLRFSDDHVGNTVAI